MPRDPHPPLTANLIRQGLRNGANAPTVVQELTQALSDLVYGLSPPEIDDDFGAARDGRPSPNLAYEAYWRRPIVVAALQALNRAEGR